jgi:hypothetical protein
MTMIITPSPNSLVQTTDHRPGIVFLMLLLPPSIEKFLETASCLWYISNAGSAKGLLIQTCGHYLLGRGKETCLSLFVILLGTHKDPERIKFHVMAIYLLRPPFRRGTANVAAKA